MRRDAAYLAECWRVAPETRFDEICRDIETAAQDAPDEATLKAALRVARRRAALLIALADLGGVWDVEAATGALTRFQETALRTVTARLLRAEAMRGSVDGLDPDHSGYFLLAMGKLGAGELNYSSDIDLIALFEPDRLPPESRYAALERFVQLTKRLVNIFGDVTVDGYVARVDLRLRPDAGATAVCLATDAAEHYYEGLGRTWERAAHIKARPIAGDLEAGASYLRGLEPFVWRRNLDYAALEDAADMLGKIRAHKGGGDLEVAGQDVKLGAGGIREIEFLAQTQQLILGGRDRSLRAPRTRDALAALTAAGRLEEVDRAALDEAYLYHRALEHRLQMVEDQQTHRLPKTPEELDRIAALMALPNAAALERETLARMRAVRRVAGPSLDGRGRAQPAALAEAASALPEPERAVELARGWFSGRLRAVRSPRARSSLERLAPALLRRLAAAPDPMHALAQFDGFLQGLPAGVQLLALFEAHPKLLDLLTEICAVAPRLAEHLAHRAQVLDAVLDRSFFAPPPDCAALRAELEEQLARAADYEGALDAARRWAAERRFQIGVGALKGVFPIDRAGRHFSDVAEAAIAALWPYVLAGLVERHGSPPGDGAAVLALGRLGSREMTAQSDLDLIIVYDADLNAMSNGPKPVSAAQYYARLTQRLTSALASPTAEGALYEVDMRLRPSGRAGPLATSLSSFRRYQLEDAWVWEHMALTRARTVAGTAEARRGAEAAVAEALAKWRDPAKIRDDTVAMRAKLDAAHAAELTRPWALKHTRGGLMDLEFVAQSGILIAGAAGVGGLDAISAFETLERCGAAPPAEAEEMIAAYRLQRNLQQICRIALGGELDPDTATPGQRETVARAAAFDSFDAAAAALTAAQAQVRAVFAERLEPPASKPEPAADEDPS